MRPVHRWTLGVMFGVLLAVAASADSGKGKRFEVTDDCARADTTFPPPGCIAGDGQVTNAEFGAALPFGHPSWRIEPPYVQERRQDEIRVRNTGGRPHTFTEVQRFGNGYVPPLNIPGAFTAPECATGPGVPSPAATATLLQPGEELRVEDLRPGTHNFQCCIHPWMRSVVKIDERGRHDN